MSKSAPKVALSASRDIPFNRLVLSQANVRRIKAGIAVEELAEDIARRTLLQSLTVRPVLDDDGRETGMFEVPSGGRSLPRARTAGEAEAPRPHRADPLHHPHRGHRRRGQSGRERAARPAAPARPIPRLPHCASAAARRRKSPRPSSSRPAWSGSDCASPPSRRVLLDLYAEDAMTLEQLMAFTVSPDHERQEQVWEALQRSYTQGALPDPPPADRGRRPCFRQARPLRQRRGLRGGGRPDPARPVPPTMAAGCRMPGCSTGSRASGWSARPRRSAPRLALGRGRARLPLTATPTACAAWPARRSR